MSKVVPVRGDLGLDDLGLSEADKRMVQADCTVVISVAADIGYLGALRDAVEVRDGRRKNEGKKPACCIAAHGCVAWPGEPKFLVFLCALFFIFFSRIVCYLVSCATTKLMTGHVGKWASGAAKALTTIDVF